MKDKKKFKEMLTALSERYGQKPSAILSRMIWDSLSPYPDDICSVAFRNVFTHGRFWKDLVPDLIDFIEKERNRITESMPTIQADYVIEHLNRYGGSVGLKTDDPITDYLMTHVWPYQTWAAKVLTKEIVWWKKDFIEAYKTRKEAGIIPQLEAAPEGKSLIECSSCE